MTATVAAEPLAEEAVEMTETAAGPRFSVVIPTWNRCNLLRDCLASLTKQSLRDFETIVVDDGSTDGTADTVAREFPWARVLPLEMNRGFCAAINAGIRQARGELILLLNNDMTCAHNFLECLSVAARSSAAAMFAPLVLWRDDPERIYSAGDRQRRNGRPEAIGFRQPLREFQHPGAIFGVSAGAGLYHRELFEQVGLFDETFIAYFEDSDLSFRARLAGLTAEYVPSAVVYHVGSASLEGRLWRRARQCFRNHALLVIRNMPTPLLLRYAPDICAERLSQARALFAAARCEFGALRAARVLLGAWFSLWRALPHALASRARIQSSRAVTIEEFGRLLD